jgi:hypothetical protein
MSLKEDENIVSIDENKEQDIQSPVVESAVVESAVVETPVVESAVVETPVVESAVVETPVVETPVVESAVVETPVVESAVVESAVVETPVVETSVEETPLVETSVEETLIEETPLEEGSQNKIEEINNMFKENTEESEKVFKEIVIGVEVNIPENELTELFLNIIKKYDEKNTDPDNYFNKMNIPLSKETIEVAEKIITKTPTLLNEVENLLVEVIKDNKIDSNDIPKFILIIQILYERIFNQKDLHIDNSKRSEICSKILKLFINILIEERKVIVDDDKKKEFLLHIITLSDSCINLLNFSNILDPPKVCCTIM